jgi:hypothetical protein
MIDTHSDTWNVPGHFQLPFTFPKWKDHYSLIMHLYLSFHKTCTLKNRKMKNSLPHS